MPRTSFPRGPVPRRHIVSALLAACCALAPLAMSPISVGAAKAPPPISIAGVAEWSSDYGYFNLRSAPDPAAPTIGTLHPGDAVQVVGSLQGGAVDGYNLWYHLRVNGAMAYVLASAIGYLRASAPWTGVASTNAEPDVSTVISLSSPSAAADSDGSFALGVTMTVLGTVEGAALEPDNDVWYRVATGDYRPAYVYSAYLKFVRMGAGAAPAPVLTAAEALAVDLDTLRPLYRFNDTAPRPPASLAKLMTVAVALDHLRPGAVLTVPDGAPSVGAEIGGTAMGLVPGERLSLRDLLYGMLLPSGNDAAYTIANAVAGSQDAFAGLMNAKAGQLGLTGTHYVQGYGLDADGQYSTAWDLARLARYDLAHYSLVDQIVRTAHHVLSAGPTYPAFDLYNTNKLLGVYPGAFGVKTGTTPSAGQNIVAAVQRNGHRVLVVIMGATDRYADATALLNYAIAMDK